LPGPTRRPGRAAAPRDPAILALKGLVAGAWMPKQQGKATFTVTVNGKEAAKGQVT
jgi:hypothetical protein